MLTNIASAGAGLIGVFIIFIGARFLWSPQVAAAAFGIPKAGSAAEVLRPWLAVKGVRDIASGLFIFVVMASREPHLLGWFTLAASLIATGDAIIVLRSGGPRAAAYGIHGVTALIMWAIAGSLLAA